MSDQTAYNAPVLAHLATPESVPALDTIADDPTLVRPDYAFGIHGFDLARFVFAGLRGAHVSNAHSALELAEVLTDHTFPPTNHSV